MPDQILLSSGRPTRPTPAAIRRRCWIWSTRTWSGPYLDPSAADPRPQGCHGRGELAAALAQQAEGGLRASWRR